MSLPKFLALKSKHNGKYLQCIAEDRQMYGFLRFSGDEAMLALDSKFEVEMGKTGDGRFVNIRSLHNNKFWVRQSKNEEWIVAGAEEPDEDESSWSCTLFQPFHVDNDPNIITLLHVQLKTYVSLTKDSPPFDVCCTVSGSTNSQIDPLEMLIVTTPNGKNPFISSNQYITFKDDKGNQQLIVQTIEEKQYLKLSAYKHTDKLTKYEVLTNEKDDKSVWIKSISHNALWRCSCSKWILVDHNGDSRRDPDTLFYPIEIGDHIVSLRASNNLYCQPATNANSQKKNCFIARTPQIFEAKLQWEDVLKQRSIYDVVYQVFEPKIYDKINVILASAETINDSDKDLIKELKLSYLHLVTKVWDSNMSKRIVHQFNIGAKVPLIMDGKGIKFIDESLQKYSWGQPITTTNEESFHYTATIPPKSILKVSLIATKGKVEIPFTYTQQNIFIDGEQLTSKFDNGLCTVTNLFDLRCEANKVEALEA